VQSPALPRSAPSIANPQQRAQDPPGLGVGRESTLTNAHIREPTPTMTPTRPPVSCRSLKARVGLRTRDELQCRSTCQGWGGVCGVCVWVHGCWAWVGGWGC
jgi:hypothetical protein